MTKQERTIEKLYQTLAKDGILAKPLAPEVILELGNTICSALKWDYRMIMRVRQVLLPYIHTQLSETKLFLICEQLIYGKEALEKGLSMGSLRDTTAMKVLCTDIYMTSAEKVLFTFKVIDGSLSGQIKQYPGSIRLVNYLASTGGLKGRKHRDFHPRELVGFRFTAVLDTQNGLTRIAKLSAAPKQRILNGLLKRKRANAECKVSCFMCPKHKASCRLATHTTKWIPAACELGHTAYFSPDGCLVCKEAAYRKKYNILSYD